METCTQGVRRYALKNLGVLREAIVMGLIVVSAFHVYKVSKFLIQSINDTSLVLEKPGLLESAAKGGFDVFDFTTKTSILDQHEHNACIMHASMFFKNRARYSRTRCHTLIVSKKNLNSSRLHLTKRMILFVVKPLL
ncbi:uncharacterized protein LOC110877931 [Helianthus annuus]|uniref:uncharacterized protein LOC110877931 n=1 Tax=Helianthus annuus TaxID=4232 RepID=UPI0016531EB5|nr:uncharacterized protein LOC110877931 [Helianthus annuus]